MSHILPFPHSPFFKYFLLFFCPLKGTADALEVEALVSDFQAAVSSCCEDTCVEKVLLFQHQNVPTQPSTQPSPAHLPTCPSNIRLVRLFTTLGWTRPPLSHTLNPGGVCDGTVSTAAVHTVSIATTCGCSEEQYARPTLLTLDIAGSAVLRQRSCSHSSPRLFPSKFLPTDCD